MFWYILYLSGVVVALILFLILAYYEKKIKKNDVQELPAAMILIIFSWIIVSATLANYGSDFADFFNCLFKKKDDKD